MSALLSLVLRFHHSTVQSLKSPYITLGLFCSASLACRPIICLYLTIIELSQILTFLIPFSMQFSTTSIALFPQSHIANLFTTSSWILTTTPCLFDLISSSKPPFCVLLQIISWHLIWCFSGVPSPFPAAPFVTGHCLYLLSVGGFFSSALAFFQL